eukprot:COSAG01_NODE_17029_length_1183_cov_4.323801_2_plen_58_part_01
MLAAVEPAAVIAAPPRVSPAPVGLKEGLAVVASSLPSTVRPEKARRAAHPSSQSIVTP